MPIQSLRDLSEFNLDELYAVYLGIANADHQWRMRAMYGDAEAATGHSEFRPLSLQQFQQRLDAAQAVTCGETKLRQRLSRQAAAYEVDVDSQLFRNRQAA